MTVSVRDGKNDLGQDDSSIDDTVAIAINVTNVDEAGAVTLGPGAPRTSVQFTAELSDPDDPVSDLTWQWSSSSDWDPSAGMGTWSDINGATSASYTPVAADAGNCLRAQASYTDSMGEDKTANAVSDSVVLTGATIWRAAMIPKNSGVDASLGWGNFFPGSSLTDPTITLNGEEHALHQIWYLTTSQWFTVEFPGSSSVDENTFDRYILKLGNRNLGFNGASKSQAYGRQRFSWWFDNPALTSGTKVELSILGPLPAKLTGLTPIPGEEEVTLNWSDPVDVGITRYQYRQKRGTGRWGSWKNMSGSGATTTSHTVTGLAEGTEYSFQVRAVNPVGNGSESSTVTTTTLSPPGASTTVSITADKTDPSPGESVLMTAVVANPPGGDPAYQWQLRKTHLQ